jgi:hypothetical protein
MTDMALPNPPIKDKDFEELALELRDLIPRYAGKWTDHNLSDPGITFLELFSWLAEMQLFQMDRLTDDIRRRFLKLVDIEPFGPKAAQTFIHFESLLEGTPSLIEAGTAILPVGKDPLRFEAAEDFFLTQSKITSIISNYDSKAIDYINLNASNDAFFIPFGQNMPQNAALQLGFNSWFKEMEIQLAIFLDESVGTEPPDAFKDNVPDWTSVQLVWEYHSQVGWQEIENLEDFTTNLTRSGRIIFQPPQEAVPLGPTYWIRCRLERGKYEVIPRINRILLNCVPVIQTETIIRENLGLGSGLPFQQFVLKNHPVIVKRTHESERFYIGDIVDWPDFYERLRLAQEEPIKHIREKHIIDLLEKQGWVFPNDPQQPTDDEKYHLIAVLNRLVASTDLYKKNAFKGFNFTAPYQAFIESLEACITDENLIIVNRYLIQRAFPDLVKQPTMMIQLEAQDRTWHEWSEVENFDKSGPDDPHYAFDPFEGRITFGNGVNGRIPSAVEHIRANFYQQTHCADGNLPEGQQWRVDKSGFSGMFGTNFLPAAGGSDAETLDDTEIRARKEFNTVYRAVTLEDYERLAMSVPGLPVARAKAIPNFDPDYPCIQKPGFITVVVVPEFWDERPYVEPGDRFIKVAQDYLDQHRLITNTIRVIGPSYVKISVKCTVFVKYKRSPDEVKKNINRALQRFLIPLERKPDEPDTNAATPAWRFGRPVYPSEIYELIDNIDGVDYLTDVKLEAEGPHRQENGAIEIPRTGLVYSGTHEIDSRTKI